jgi:hypothetical protein
LLKRIDNHKSYHGPLIPVGYTWINFSPDHSCLYPIIRRKALQPCALVTVLFCKLLRGSTAGRNQTVYLRATTTSLTASTLYPRTEGGGFCPVETPGQKKYWLADFQNTPAMDDFIDILKNNRMVSHPCNPCAMFTGPFVF